MHINKVLSEPLHVEPLKEGEIAEFRLVGADRLDKNGLPIRRAGITIPGEASIVDPHDGGKAKLIQNIVSYRAIQREDGTVKQEPIIEMVKFGKTNTLTLTYQQNETYGFLMRHHRCLNNKFRTSGKKPLFYLVNPREKAMKVLKDEDMSLDARITVRDADSTELFAIAKKLNIAVGDDAEVVRANLIKRAKSAPLTIIGASDNALLKSKIRVREAIELNFIDFEPTERVWFWADDPKHTVIVAAPETKNPLNFIVDYVQQEDGRKFYNALLKKLKNIDNKTNGS